eukprot:TRINITY_DN7146_c0_g1_i1.p1 TRINITY_DN7146_c0_g1~~TRINITY_DN7146_c0_g1_i1.p1  ORF type:complete len:998 (+),score=292.15 TRINITY_DN7146_c0_g1_i1:129-3122(+)
MLRMASSSGGAPREIQVEEVKEDLDAKTDTPREERVVANQNNNNSNNNNVVLQMSSENIQEIRVRQAHELEYVLSKKRLGEEKQTMSYTSVMLRDPRQFVEAGYKLHFTGIKTFIVVTMYNEAPDELVLTLRGICENIRVMMKKLAAPELWKEIAVCIVSDGREKANPETLQFLESIGVYVQARVDKTLQKKSGELDKLGMHVFETTSVFVDHPDLETEFPPLQLIFALKEHNGGKIDSHWWFFEAFSQYLKPEFCFLIDVGTKPRRKAFFHIYRAFQRNDQIGGACGQITTRNLANFNPIVAAQHFEYKIANILDKSLESVCGFISVLPGAFSAYRFEAVCGEPLRKYFHHIENKGQNVSPFEANMYLAEDRILCFELFAKKDQHWTLHYIMDSMAETDVPTSLIDLMKQRRRWINGSFFALIYALLGFWRVWFQTNHSILRKLVATVEFLYYFLSLVLTWFLIGLFYLTIYYSTRIIFEDSLVALVILMVLVAIIMLQFFCGLADNKPAKFSTAYHLSSFTLAVLFMFVSVVTIINLINEISSYQSWVLLASIAASFGIYFIAAIVYGELMSIFLSLSQYWALIPTFTVVFPVFSMCNVHDISWGTKNIEAVAAAADNNKADNNSEKQFMSANMFRMWIVLLWVVCNGALVAALTVFSDQFTPEQVLFGIFCAVLAINGTRMAGSIIYWFSKIITRAEEIDQNRVEKKYFKQMRKAMGRSSQTAIAQSEQGRIARLFTVAFKPRTWVSISNCLFLSGVVGIIAAGWCAVTGVLSIPLLLLFPAGPFMISAFALSWRILARMEFEINSNDGLVARVLGIDSSSESRSSLRCPSYNVPMQEGQYFVWMRTLLSDPFTFKALSYFLVPKLIMFGISWACSVSMFALSLFLTFSGLIRSACGTDGGALICQFYYVITNPSWGAVEPLKWILTGSSAWVLTVPLGLLLFLISCHFVNWLDWKSRSAASVLLGEEIVMVKLSHGKPLKEQPKAASVSEREQ